MIGEVMVKKLFTTAKVLTFGFFLITTTGQLYSALSERNEYSYGDLNVYREKPNTQPMPEYSHQLSTFEKSMIAADKSKNFIEYNKERLRDGPRQSFLFLLFLIVFEKWLFWLLKKDPA